MRISVADATARGESLCLIRPAPGSFSFTAKKRGETDIAAELEKRASRLKQQSMLDDPLDPIEPCPFDFRAKFKAGEASHSCDCGDWETDAMFRNFNRALGESAALDAMNETFNTRYPRDGMAIAMGTIASRPKQWTMLGIIRLDRGQRDLF